MGCFSYICPVCGLSIREGEKCVLIHKREGKEVGRTTGTYDGYGGVEEDASFRKGTGLNSHEEICQSEFRLPTSFSHGRIRQAPDGVLFDSGNVYNTIWHFVRLHSFESLKSSEKYSQVANSDLEKRCEQEVNFILRFNQDCSPEARKSLYDGVLQDRLRFELEHNPVCLAGIFQWAESLPPWTGASSGIVAAHKKCFDAANDEERNKMPFSLPDPEQGWGGARKEFCTE